MTSKQVPDEASRTDARTRRGVLLAVGAAGVTALAGCSSPSESGPGTDGTEGDPMGGTETDPLGGTTTDELGEQTTTDGTGETTTDGTGETTTNGTEEPTTDGTGETTTDDQAGTTTSGGEALTSPIRLGGRTSAWVGQEPQSISDAQNPTLRLQADTEYELVWENLDGVDHELKIVDQSGEDLESSDSAEEQGATVRMTFTASQSMAEYYCEYHPDSMRGSIEIVQ